MGQYYELFNVTENIKIEHSFDTIGGMKLMEHSYLGNPLSIYLRDKLSNEWAGDIVVHCGDYATDGGGSAEEVAEKYKDIFENENIETVKIPKSLVNKYKDKQEDWNVKPYVVNLTKKCYLDIREAVLNYMFIWYDRKKAELGVSCSIPDPLLLLIASGNGLGGGDYWTEAQDNELIGNWAGDRIQVSEFKPKEYSKIRPFFTEQKTKLKSENSVKEYIETIIKSERIIELDDNDNHIGVITKDEPIDVKTFVYYGSPNYKDFIIKNVILNFNIKQKTK